MRGFSGKTKPVQREKVVSAVEAVQLAQALSKANFDETIECAFNLGVSIQCRIKLKSKY